MYFRFRLLTMNRLHIFFCLLCFFLLGSACKNESAQIVKRDLPKLQYELVKPQFSEEKPLPLLVVLHGRGSNAENSMNWASQLGKEWLVVTIQAPHLMEIEKYQWYPMEFQGKKRIYDYNDMLESKDLVLNTIRHLQQENSINDQKIVVAGFSQGAYMAGLIALEEPSIVEGVAILSGGLVPEVEIGKKLGESWRDLEVFISHGRQDAVLDFEEARASANFLAELDIKVTARWYDSGHTISSQNFQDLYNWLEMMRVK